MVELEDAGMPSGSCSEDILFFLKVTYSHLYSLLAFLLGSGLCPENVAHFAKSFRLRSFNLKLASNVSCFYDLQI